MSGNFFRWDDIWPRMYKRCSIPTLKSHYNVPTECNASKEANRKSDPKNNFSWWKSTHLVLLNQPLAFLSYQGQLPARVTAAQMLRTIHFILSWFAWFCQCLFSNRHLTQILFQIQTNTIQDLDKYNQYLVKGKGVDVKQLCRRHDTFPSKPPSYSIHQPKASSEDDIADEDFSDYNVSEWAIFQPVSSSCRWQIAIPSHAQQSLQASAQCTHISTQRILQYCIQSLQVHTAVQQSILQSLQTAKAHIVHGALQPLHSAQEHTLYIIAQSLLLTSSWTESTTILPSEKPLSKVILDWPLQLVHTCSATRVHTSHCTELSAHCNHVTLKKKHYTSEKPLFKEEKDQNTPKSGRYKIGIAVGSRRRFTHPVPPPWAEWTPPRTVSVTSPSTILQSTTSPSTTSPSSPSSTSQSSQVSTLQIH